MGVLTYQKLGTHGRLGNQLFQIAAMIGLSKRYNMRLVLPPWAPSRYFEFGVEQGHVHPQYTVEESGFHHDAMHFDRAVRTDATVNVAGWLQSEKYWEDNKRAVKNCFAFNPDVIKRVYAQYGQATVGKPTIGLCVRRGDFVDNPNYAQLPPSYYYLALLEHFDLEKHNILVFSDDIPYCKVHFECLPNVTFVEGLDPGEQLALGSFCSDFVIANSTFAWWLAYLSAITGSKVIRPAHHFDGPLKQSSDSRDHYPDKWIKFDHLDQHGTPKRLDMRDVTFVVPVHYDHTDRKENLDLALAMLTRDFDTNVTVMEQGSIVFGYTSAWCKYEQTADKYFHRTKMINDMSRSAVTPIVVNYDADVFIPAMQLWLAAQQIRSGESDFVYPYDGRFARVQRVFYRNLQKNLDLGALIPGMPFSGTTPRDEPSVGGAVMYNKTVFFDAGGENEKFISYAPEDRERFYRFNALGYKVSRIVGILYHLDHFISLNSSTKHQHFKGNNVEYDVVKNMDKHTLREYIKIMNK
jgi:hypothetical protein